METINIVELIEKNTIDYFTTKYNNKLLSKIQKNLNLEEQKFFVSIFYVNQKYDKDKDHVIDLDDIWEWLGYSQKSSSKRLIKKHFTLDKDYKILKLSDDDKKREGRGGHNKEKLMLTINTFKKLCLKTDTKKSDEIQNFYLKIEEIIFETIIEQNEEFSNELKNLKLKIAENNDLLNNHQDF